MQLLVKKIKLEFIAFGVEILKLNFLRGVYENNSIKTLLLQLTFEKINYKYLKINLNKI